MSPDDVGRFIEEAGRKINKDLTVRNEEKS
jgi:hypothetical protein